MSGLSLGFQDPSQVHRHMGGVGLTPGTAPRPTSRHHLRFGRHMSIHTLNSSATDQPVQNSRRQANKERTETVSRLQRGILRMSLAHHGQNAELDRHLKELGGLLRSGRRDERLQDLIDEIVEIVVTLDQQRNPAEAHGDPVQDNDSSPLVHFLDHLTTPTDVQKEIDGVRDLIAAKQQTADIIAQAEKAAQAISNELEGSANDQDTIASTRDTLVALIEDIPISVECSIEAARLKHSILGASELNELRPCTTALADLIRAMRNELQSEIDNLSNFLRSTAQRLYEFESMMNSSRDLHTDSSKDAMQLSDTIGGDINELREDVLIADDLDQVKSMIDVKLTSMDKGLSTFVDTQQQRASEANQTIDNMVSKLKDLESEAEHLRDDLEKQQARVLIDPLTGVLNRSGYLETAGKQFARWKRYGGAISLAVIDLDLFKKINDRYGHAAGDKVLSTVATHLSDQIRESDILCRVGGEEFVLILPETTSEDGFDLLDKLRAHIEDCGFRYKETPVPVTLSAGVAQFRDSDRLDDVFERADQAMYQAKRKGRNQICSEADIELGAA